MFCAKCGKEMADHSRFCPFCGAAVQQAAPVKKAPVHVSVRKAAPKSEEAPAPKPETPASTVFITNPVLPEKKPEPMPEPVRIPEPVPDPILEPTPAPQPEQPKPAKKKGGIWLIALICVVLAAALAVGFVFLSGGRGGYVYTTTDGELVYLKDLKEEGKAIVLSDDCTGNPLPVFSANGRYLYYLEDDVLRGIKVSDIENRVKPKRVASGLKNKQMIALKDGGLVYWTEGSDEDTMDIWLYSGGRTYKLAESVQESWFAENVDPEQKYLYYETLEDETRMLYRVKLRHGAEPELLIDRYDEVYCFGMEKPSDLDRTEALLFRKQSDVYSVVFGEKEKKLVSDVEKVFCAGADKEDVSFYYTTAKEDPVPLYEFVSDDDSMAHTHIRSLLKEETLELERNALYYYKNGVVTEVADWVSDEYSIEACIAGDTKMVFFRKSIDPNYNAIEISAVESVLTMRGWLEIDHADANDENYVAVNGVPSVLEADSSLAGEHVEYVVPISKNEVAVNMICLLDEDPRLLTHVMYCYTVEGTALKHTLTIDDGVWMLCNLYNDKLYYGIMSDEGPMADIYVCSNEQETRLVSDARFLYALEDGNYYALVDPYVGPEREILGTLCWIDRYGNDYEISEDVLEDRLPRCAPETNQLLFIDARRRLRFWDGSDSRIIARDVVAVWGYETLSIAAIFG